MVKFRRHKSAHKDLRCPFNFYPKDYYLNRVSCCYLCKISTTTTFRFRCMISLPSCLIDGWARHELKNEKNAQRVEEK